ncbi:MAG: YIP1 family protein [Bryobacteraceae bacterium]|nr:YIP1 family protein [Bryobacteraceae bacterium]
MTGPEQKTALSEFERMAGVFTDPGRVFADVAERGRWWLVLLVLIALNVVVMTLMVGRVGYDQMIEKAFEQSPRLQEMSPEQRMQAMEQQRKFMPIAIRVLPPLAMAAALFVVAGVLLFSFRMLLDAEVKYGHALNITAYAWLPPAVAGNAMFLALLYLKPPEEFDAEAAGGLSIGSFLSRDTAPWLRSLASSFDLFTLWTILLIAAGFSAYCGKRKMPFGRALWGVLAPWFVYVLGKMGFAALMG